MSNDFDIIIIGGSFAGLTSALSLAKSIPHLNIAIIEKSNIIDQDRQRDGRAFAISKSSLEIFKNIGILEDLRPSAGIIEGIKIVDGNSPFYLNFDSDKSGDRELGLVIENFYIHNALRNKAKAQIILNITAQFFQKLFLITIKWL